jgi:hypothetical protein
MQIHGLQCTGGYERDRESIYWFVDLKKIIINKCSSGTQAWHGAESYAFNLPTAYARSIVSTPWFELGMSS